MYKIIGADGKEYGPITLAQLKQWVAEGRLNQQSKVLPDGATDWTTVAQLPELANAMPPLTPPPNTMAGADVPSYLWQSIVITLCCCLPFGIVAIVYAAQVKTKLSVGDFAGAQESSSKAKMWCWIGLIVGIITNVIVGAIQFMAIAASGSHSM